jgi:hypothetical protein
MWPNRGDGNESSGGRAPVVDSTGLGAAPAPANIRESRVFGLPDHAFCRKFGKAAREPFALSRVQAAPTLAAQPLGDGKMSTLIARLYDSPADALGAVTELKSAGYVDGEVNLIAPAPVAGHANDNVAASIEKAGVPPGDAEAFAAAVAQGKALVTVRAALGAAVGAIEILDAHGPANATSRQSEYYSTSVASPNPLSDALGWSLLSDDPAPFSSFFGIPALSKSAAPLSPFLGLPLLARSSSNRTRSNYSAPFSAFFGLPLLVHQSTTAVGRTRLIDDGAPFSHWLGLPLLTKGDTGRG